MSIKSPESYNNAGLGHIDSITHKQTQAFRSCVLTDISGNCDFQIRHCPSDSTIVIYAVCGFLHDHCSYNGVCRRENISIFIFLFAVDADC